MKVKAKELAGLFAQKVTAAREQAKREGR
jgi:hypothetical protein